MDKFIEKALHGDGDSDRHFITLYAMALASRGKNYVELGVREGHTTEPLYEAAKAEGIAKIKLNNPSDLSNSKIGAHELVFRADSWDFSANRPVNGLLGINGQDIFKQRIIFNFF